MSVLARLRGPMWLCSLGLLLGAAYMEYEREDRDGGGAAPAASTARRRGAGTMPLIAEVPERGITTTLDDPSELPAAAPQPEAYTGRDPAADTRVAAPAPQPLPEPEPAAARGFAAVDTARDLMRRQLINADIEERALQAGRSRVSVTMYKTAWCGACKTAVAYMREHDIACVERDLDTDPGARDDMHRLNPRGSVPTIDVDGDVMVGWSQRRFETALDRAARAQAQNL